MAATEVTAARVEPVEQENPESIVLPTQATEVLEVPEDQVAMEVTVAPHLL